ncbi:hypothetical protein HNQ93_002225 [Hymenobacter luteus]|uniref:DUF4197 domain-containing protein n=2 Tax=Hymenobacter TaxID=89966 RepID=A0A7W9T0T2_9BACT|nr:MULTISPECIES: DUF4197 domain-containing protein [Hymenobacter]MBB4602206.1 hypothetical protein [Hymenobacter latericoloratus]MBB6059365.1 hypothetical protein [Hymenobacter luteus]
MPPLRTLALGLTLTLASAQLAAAQSKTTPKKTTTVSKKPTTAKKATPNASAAKPAATPTTPVKVPLTADEASSGLREALSQGVTRAVAQGSAPDGFTANADIRIPFPPEAEIVALTLRKLKAGALVDNFEVALNRAAETASAQAKPIFLNAVQNLTLQDALTLATSRESDAATTLLYEKTAADLRTAFQPTVQQSLDQTGATRLYAEMVARYNKIPLVTKLSPQLAPYATEKTVDGLFALIAAEEGRIRQNPAGQGSALLKRVFGK